MNILPFKNYLILAAVAIYSFGIWHVSAVFTDRNNQKEKVELAQKAIETQQQRQALAAQLGAKIDTAIGNIQITNKTINREVVHEVTKEPVYTNCVTTTNGLQLIERAIDNKGQPTNK